MSRRPIPKRRIKALCLAEAQAEYRRKILLAQEATNKRLVKEARPPPTTIVDMKTGLGCVGMTLANGCALF